MDISYSADIQMTTAQLEYFLRRVDVEQMNETDDTDHPTYGTHLEVFHDKLIGKKWKKMIGLVFEESTYGRARMELYQNEEKVRSGSPSRTILLTDCVSMRAHSQAGQRETIRILLKDNSTLEIFSQNHDILLEALCKIAFPKKYVTLPSTLLDSPTSSEEEDFVLSDQYPVLLLPSPLTKTKQLSEGSYHLHFGDSLSLITGELQVLSFNYCDLLWIAAGENCLGFEIIHDGIYEFICAQPLVIMESFRCHIRFTSIFTPVSVKTTNKYNRTYHPSKASVMDTPETSKNSTLESKQSTSSMSPPPPPDSFSEFTPQSTSSPLNNSFTSEYEAFPSEEKQKKSGIFSFFRRNSKKRRDEEGRPSFEQDANSEWLRIEKTLPPNSSPDKKVEEHLHILNFRQELEKSLAESKMRREKAYQKSADPIPEE